MLSFQIKDYDFQYTAKGKGPALIFLHDGLLHSVGWHQQIDYFKDRFSVIAYDRRGYGENDLDGNPYSDEDDLLALLDHFKLKQAILIGCSNGARLALSFTTNHPERVSKMILTGPALPGYAMSAEHQKRVSFAMEPLKRSENTDESIKRWCEDLFYVHPTAKTAKKFLSESLKKSPHNLINMGRFKNRRDDEPPLEALGYIDQETLILVGDQDSADSLDRAETCARLLVNSKLLKLPGMAHLPHLENASKFNQYLDDFLDQ